MVYEWYRAPSVWPSLTVSHGQEGGIRGAARKSAQFSLWMWLSSIQNLVQFYLHQTCSLTLKVYDI